VSSLSARIQAVATEIVPFEFFILRLLCVLGVSAVRSLLAGIPPPRRKARGGFTEKKRFSERLPLPGLVVQLSILVAA